MRNILLGSLSQWQLKSSRCQYIKKLWKYESEFDEKYISWLTHRLLDPSNRRVNRDPSRRPSSSAGTRCFLLAFPRIIIINVSKTVPILGTFFTFGVLIGSLFMFQGPYFQCFGQIYVKKGDSVWIKQKHEQTCVIGHRSVCYDYLPIDMVSKIIGTSSVLQF